MDQRRAEGRTPLWAERMNLSGGQQGPQSSTIYGYREEYKPSQKTDARSRVRAGQFACLGFDGRNVWEAGQHGSSNVQR